MRPTTNRSLREIANATAPPLGTIIGRFVDEYQKGDYEAGFRILLTGWDYRMPEPLYQEIASIVNTSLAPKELELTGHGILRSFRFWSPAEKSAYLTAAT